MYIYIYIYIYTYINIYVHIQLTFDKYRADQWRSGGCVDEDSQKLDL